MKTIEKCNILSPHVLLPEESVNIGKKNGGNFKPIIVK
jgi:hypothetical protein